MKLLAVSGSLRAASINSSLLRAAVRIAPLEIDMRIFAGLGELPLFNPDLDADPPAEVATWQAAIASADALLIASPEYAHGVTGTIKNALDWLVSFPPFYLKPVAVLNAAPRAHHADDALRETLHTMSARIIEPASIGIALLGSGLDEDGMVASPMVSAAVIAALSALEQAVIDGAGGQSRGDFVVIDDRRG